MCLFLRASILILQGPHFTVRLDLPAWWKGRMTMMAFLLEKLESEQKYIFSILSKAVVLLIPQLEKKNIPLLGQEVGGEDSKGAKEYEFSF
jgi:hypothetical protein